MKDTLFNGKDYRPDLFVFDDQVARVFPDMINRSVPGYSAIISMIGNITERFSKPNTYLYDLGCSLGAAATMMASHSQCQVIGVDSSSAMIERANRYSSDNLRFLCDDITQLELQPASIIVLNFTLQFIPINQRKPLLKKLFNCLIPGGVLILSEKICFEDDRYNQLMIDLHHQFKRDNGYSDMEIANKRNALEHVLLPETKSTHQTRLHDCGFSHIDAWFQCYNFTSLIALK